ncbi:hypothetical protein [Enhygromyxa salina]|uniref:Uncharacterized protein n=1 Tax=Enhygromyxa salina TaxID=215803 RepID=A0A2S9Y3J4_9BACT|nr:hypothetical protein [Enhygromyxa salina]PRP99631.1 hypothetical protein ENSA7_62710 [Enhygromyxa salina]
MSAHFRAVALVREARSLLGPALSAARSLRFRLADRRREAARAAAIPALRSSEGRLFHPGL